MQRRSQSNRLPPWMDKDYVDDGDLGASSVSRDGRQSSYRSSSQQYAGAAFDSYDGSAPFGSPPRPGFISSRSGVAPPINGIAGATRRANGQHMHTNQHGAPPPPPPPYRESERGRPGYGHDEPPAYSEPEHGESGHRNGGQAYGPGMGTGFTSSSQGGRREHGHREYTSSSRTGDGGGTRTGGTSGGMFGGSRRIPSPSPRYGVDEPGDVESAERSGYAGPHMIESRPDGSDRSGRR